MPSTVDTIAAHARWLRRMVADLPADVSPWAAPGVYLGSVDFFKRNDVARSLEAQIWDLLVVDEAHTATSPTDRHAALSTIAARARRIVTITATPFSGDTASFASLAALGSGRWRTAAPDVPAVPRGRRRKSRRRRHQFVPVPVRRAESRLQRLLERYPRDVGGRLPAMSKARGWRHDSAQARVVVAGGGRPFAHAAAGIAPRAGDVAPLDNSRCSKTKARPEDELPDAALATPGLADAALEPRWLAILVARPRGGGGRLEKRCLGRLLRRVRDEADCLHRVSRHAASARGRPAAVAAAARRLDGGRARVGAGAIQRPGGLLLATDAAAEGLNLQRRCRLVVNYELPWNPARLEQRIGRVDRIGQQRTVHAITLVARDTAEDSSSPGSRAASPASSRRWEKGPSRRVPERARTARLVIAGVPE